MPDIAGVSHVALTVPDLARSAPWYQELFGLQKTSEEHGPGHGVVVFRHPGSGLVIALHQHAGGASERFNEATTGLDHVSFLVSSLAELREWEAEFARRGITHSPIVHAPYGSVLVFRDPDNIQLELLAAPGT